MSRSALYENIKAKQSFLCVGLDTDLGRIPKHLLTSDDPIFEFNKQIIDQTQDLVIAYKPNTAFYEALGPKGMEALKKTIEYIPDDIMVIADAKRGDIGNTSRLYAQSFFEYYNADALTVAPYMGEDSIGPFLEYDDRWIIILGLTSNKGSQDFQHIESKDGVKLHEQVLRTCASYGTTDNTMFVIGATQAEHISEIRKIVPDHFFLVPGVGAQGGSLSAVAEHGLNDHVGLIVNSSRGIIYASDGEDFAEHARAKALELQSEMALLLGQYDSRLC